MKKHREENNGQEWLNTYADMITLVLTFFVLLYSISNVNVTKLQQVAEAMQKKLGIETTVELSDVPKDLKYPAIGESTLVTDNTSNTATDTTTANGAASASSMAMSDMAKEIQTYFNTEQVDALVSQSNNAVYIRFKNDLLFDPDSALLRDGSQSMLEALGIMLKAKENDIGAVYINGHTAQSATSLVNDRLLSSERADRVAIFLEEKVGFAPEKLICRGYGKYYPIADNSTKEGREQNRRVDIIILGSGYKLSDVVPGEVGLSDPLFPVTMPDDMNKAQEGTAQ